MSKSKIKNKNSASSLNKNKYAIMFFIFSVIALVYKLIVGGFGNDTDYIGYTFSYGLGFLHNLFVGTIERLFVGYVEPADIKIFSIGATIVILFVVSLFFGKAVEKTDEKIRTPYAFVIGTVIVMTVFINELSSLNIFSVLYLTLSFMCLSKESTRKIIPIICFVAMLTDKNFIFGCFIPLLFTMIYVFSKDKMSSEKKSNKIVLFSSSGICAVMFLFFEFFEGKLQESADTVIADWLSSSNVAVDKELFSREYILSSSERIKALLVTDYKERLIEIAGTLIPIVFLLAIFIAFWIFVLKATEEKPCRGLCVSVISYVLIIFTVSIFIDIELSFAAVSSVYALVFPTVYFVSDSDEKYIKATENFWNKNEMLVILLTVFSISSIYFSSKVYNSITESFIEKWWMPF